MRTRIGRMLVATLTLTASLAVATPTGLAAHPSDEHEDTSEEQPAPPSEAPTPAVGVRDAPRDPYFPKLGDRRIDVEHYEIALSYDPPATLEGDVRLIITAVDDLERFSLDFARMRVQDVTVDAQEADFEQRTRKLIVEPENPIAAGTQFVTEVVYDGKVADEKIAGIDGPGWTRTDGGILTVNEPDGATYVFPSNNHPRDKATFRFTLDAPAELTALGNGELIERTDEGERTRWVWYEDAPMAPYTTQIAFDDVELQDAPPVGNVKLRNAYAPKVRDKAEPAVARTGEMIEYLGSWFGPYPFDVYGVLAPDGGPDELAFEATTFSVVSDDIFADETTGSSTLAHELTHQWFGDWVSPATWPDIWRNEGFAQYGQWLWGDHALGIPLAQSIEQALRIIEADPRDITDPGRKTLFHPTVYMRGALAVHALRMTVGDQQFAQILRTYLERYGGGIATVDDFIDIANEIHGSDLRNQFTEWFGPDEFPVDALGLDDELGSDPPT